MFLETTQDHVMSPQERNTNFSKLKCFSQPLILYLTRLEYNDYLIQENITSLCFKFFSFFMRQLKKKIKLQIHRTIFSAFRFFICFGPPENQILAPSLL